MHAKNDIIDRLSRFRCFENVALCTNGRWVPFTATSALMSVVALIANGPVYRVAVSLVEGCDPSSVYIATYSGAHASNGKRGPLPGPRFSPALGPAGNSCPATWPRQRVETNATVAPSPKNTPPSAPSWHPPLATCKTATVADSLKTTMQTKPF